MHSTHYIYSDWPKAFSVFSKSALGTSSTSRLHNDHVKGHSRSRIIMSCMTAISDGNHVKFARVLCCSLIFTF